MGLSVWQILLVILLLLLLFGRGKIPQLMGDIAEGIKNFRDGMGKASPEDQPEPAPQLPESAGSSVPSTSALVQATDRV